MSSGRAFAYRANIKSKATTKLFHCKLTSVIQLIFTRFSILGKYDILSIYKLKLWQNISNLLETCAHVLRNLLSS